MANTKPINKENPKNIYCGHCEHFTDSGKCDRGCAIWICKNQDSKHFRNKRYYYHRCKKFEWKVTDNA